MASDPMEKINYKNNFILTNVNDYYQLLPTPVKDIIHYLS